MKIRMSGGYLKGMTLAQINSVYHEIRYLINFIYGVNLEGGWTRSGRSVLVEFDETIEGGINSVVEMMHNKYQHLQLKVLTN